MAKGGGKKRSYVRDGNGRFASTPGGGKSAALKGGTLSKRSSLKGSRAKLKAKDAADPSIRNTLSTRAQKGAVTRGNKALRAAKAASQRTAVGRSKAGTVAKGKKPSVLKATVLKPQAARVPASQRPGSMTSTLRATMGALAKADAKRIREVESITGQKVKPTAAGAKAGREAGARVRAAAKGGKVSDTLRAGLRELAQSDARTMRGMAGIVRDATPKVSGGKGGKALKGAKKALPAAKAELVATKPSARTKGSRTTLPRAPGTVAKPKGLKPGMPTQKMSRPAGRPLGGESKKTTGARIKRPGTMKPPLALARMKEIGGKRWQKNNMDRVYFNDLASKAGLDVDRYNSGSISSASLKGKSISNSKAKEIYANLESGKVYFDRKTRKMVAQSSRETYGRSTQRTTAQELLGQVAKKLERQSRMRPTLRANQKRRRKK